MSYSTREKIITPLRRWYNQAERDQKKKKKIRARNLLRFVRQGMRGERRDSEEVVPMCVLP